MSKIYDVYVDDLLLGDLRSTLSNAISNSMLSGRVKIRVVCDVCNSFGELCKNSDDITFYSHYRYICGAIIMLLDLELISLDDYNDIQEICKSIYEDIAEQRARKLSADEED